MVSLSWGPIIAQNSRRGGSNQPPTLPPEPEHPSGRPDTARSRNLCRPYVKHNRRLRQFAAPRETLLPRCRMRRIILAPAWSGAAVNVVGPGGKHSPVKPAEIAALAASLPPDSEWRVSLREL